MSIWAAMSTFVTEGESGTSPAELLADAPSVAAGLHRLHSSLGYYEWRELEELFGAVNQAFRAALRPDAPSTAIPVGWAARRGRDEVVALIDAAGLIAPDLAPPATLTLRPTVKRKRLGSTQLSESRSPLVIRGAFETWLANRPDVSVCEGIAKLQEADPHVLERDRQMLAALDATIPTEGRQLLLADHDPRCIVLQDLTKQWRKVGIGSGAMPFGRYLVAVAAGRPFTSVSDGEIVVAAAVVDV